MKPIEKAKSKTVLPENGTPVKITTNILSPEKCGGFFVKQHHIDARKPNVNGTYIGWVPGGGGDLWWIKHEDETIGCYLFTEVEDAD